MGSMYERDHVMVDTGMDEDGKEFIGHNIRAHIEDLEKKMREAAGDLEFETAARLRDEIKRLQAVELKIADDPFARQSEVDRAVDDAMIAVSGEENPSKPRTMKRGKGRRLDRPGRPKTFGSRSR